MSIKQQFTRWARDEREEALGRIHFDPNRWVFSTNAPPPEDEDDKRSRFPKPDANGDQMELIRGRGTWCKNSKWEGKFPLSENGRYNVSYGACSKCEHYRKSTRAVRFPCCAWYATATTPKEAKSHAAKSILDTVDRAFNDVDRLLGGDA